jgi:DNA primase
MLVPAVDLDDVRARVPIAAVLRLYGLARTLEESAMGYSGECPFCHLTGFQSDAEANRFRCSACGKSGGAVEFVMYREGVSPWIAGLMLADWFRVRVRVTRTVSGEAPPERLCRSLPSLPLSGMRSASSQLPWVFLERSS